MFEKLTDNIVDAGLHVHGIEVLINGETALHRCFDSDVRYPVYSVTKSITSAAFAIASDEGKLSADEPLCEYLESRYRSAAPEGLRKLTFHRFLTMTAGAFPFRPCGDDWTEYILSLPTDYSDCRFHYSNIPAYLVGAACENAVGERLPEYLAPRLFEPLGIPAPPYQTCPQGHFYGATGMELTVHELALLGQLYLQKGLWYGKQLISPEMAERSVSPLVQAESGSYGYFFRVSSDCFSINGKWGQRCFIYPEKQLVIAYLSDLPERAGEMERIASEIAASL